MKINVIGLGYVGLPTAVMIASSKYIVTGIDVNLSLVNELSQSKHSVEDSSLHQLLVTKTGKYLFFDTNPSAADYHFIAVPTPFMKTSKKVDLMYIRQVIDRLIQLDQETLKIVIESTVSPGTIELLEREYSKSNKNLVFFHAPERILPGNSYEELIKNDRVIGSKANEDVQDLIDIYKSFSKGEIIVTNIITAELSKVIENSFRDVNIAFANEIARICHELRVDVSNLISIANKHPRVNILNPGPGVGGHCIPVDPWFLVGDFPNLTNVISASRRTNDSMPAYIVDRILDISKKNKIELNKIGIYGLTYKADVVDFRESPSYEIINQFYRLTAIKPVSYDPFVEKDNRDESSFIDFIESIDLIVVLVAHQHIKNRFNYIHDKLVFDVVNIINQGNVIKL